MLFENNKNTIEYINLNTTNDEKKWRKYGGNDEKPPCVNLLHRERMISWLHNRPHQQVGRFIMLIGKKRTTSGSKRTEFTECDYYKQTAYTLGEIEQFLTWVYNKTEIVNALYMLYRIWVNNNNIDSSIDDDDLFFDKIDDYSFPPTTFINLDTGGENWTTNKVEVLYGFYDEIFKPKKRGYIDTKKEWWRQARKVNTLKVDESNLHTKIKDYDRYDRHINLDKIIRNLKNNYQFEVNIGKIKELGYEELFMRTKCSRLFYSIFHQVSHMSELNGYACLNLGHHDDIRDRFVIENIELMFNTIQELVNRLDYYDDGSKRCYMLRDLSHKEYKQYLNDNNFIDGKYETDSDNDDDDDNN